MNVEIPENEPLIVMTRTFDAPRDLVWTAFTDPRHVTKWYGGSAFGGRVREMDLRPGGLWKHTLVFKNGTEMEMDFVYVDVDAPKKLSWKNAAPPTRGMLAVVNTVTLEDAGKHTKWRLEARFDSIAERDQASKNGFAQVIADGSETLNALLRAEAA